MIEKLLLIIFLSTIFSIMFLNCFELIVISIILFSIIFLIVDIKFVIIAIIIVGIITDWRRVSKVFQWLDYFRKRI